jgi:DNA-binding transcriptional regulator YhcF (GntR family)
MQIPVSLTVAALVREQIADGTLKPGQLAPSAEELHRSTGHSSTACRKALRALVASGALVRGPSQGSRPRIAGDPPNAQAGTDAARELSAALADRRRAAWLTQPELAALIGVSVTSVAHAETGRLWQGRAFWARADETLRAGGELLTRYDAYLQTRTASALGTAGGRASLTADEREAVQLAGHLYALIAERVIADGPTRDDDLAELRAAVHVIQRMVLAQAAARAYPREFRLLGGVVSGSRNSAEGGA